MTTTTWHSGVDAMRTRGYQRAAARAGEQGFSWFVTPGQLEAKAAELGAAFDALDRSVREYKPAAAKAEQWQTWRLGWNDFRAAWEALRSKIANEIGTRWSGGTAELILQFQDKLAQWQRDFVQKWGAELPGPPVERVQSVASSSSPAWRTVAIGVAIGVGTGLILYALKRGGVVPA